MRDTIIVIVLAFVAIAIGAWFFFYNPMPTGQATPAVALTPTAVDVPFTVLSSGTQSSVLERKNYLITSDAELRQLWKMIGNTDPAPTVDFTQNEVIAVFAGTEPTAGYTIAVSKILDATERLVTITLDKPGGSCVLADMITAPYQIISLAKSSLPLAHQELDTTTSCLQ